jgi:hypothetical protein
MSSELLTSAKCFLFTYDKEIVGFGSAIPLPHGSLQNAYRGHRTVVLPSFQGFGLGPKIADIVAGIARANDYSIYTKTVHPSLGEYREKSPLWEGTPNNRKERYSTVQTNLPPALMRLSYCHKYVGPSLDEMKELWFEPLFDRVENEIMHEEKKKRLQSSGLFKFMNKENT